MKTNLDLLSFEGYTVKNSSVSLLLDRGLFNKGIKGIDCNELFKTLDSLSSFKLQAKVRFAKQLNCPYLFYCYSYIDEDCILVELKATAARLLASFETYKAFADWNSKYRDLSMTSRYEESGLPRLDLELRKLHSPWPGNLDYVLIKDEKPRALIEFQRTIKTSVKSHCNNTWFLPTAYRKGDVNRWRAIDIIRKQSGLPLFIIVWSADERVVKLKLVDKIIYPEDSGQQKGLGYKLKEVMTAERMVEILSRY
ncbi:hypothetical protein [Dehalococcoides mccartyi]|uniref:hypothetical protein n=1 Tax=Dehalococcoides mccartyi TaxID=61435 RepID=UPI0011DD4776|nr:hypothetical protein [Dehalococcoides mccartyi]